MKRPIERNLYRLFILLVAVTTCCGCAPELRIPGITPAEVGWESVRDIALLRFDGPHGETVQQHVRARLTEVRHFNPLDTAGHPALDQISYDMVEGAKFLQITEELQADLIIVGRATGEVSDAHGTDRVEVKEGTGYYKKEKDIDGQWVDVEIKRTVLRSLPYVIRQASLTTDYRVFETKTGRAIAAGTLTETYNDKIGGDNWEAVPKLRLGEIPSANVTFDELAARIAARLVAKLSRMKTAALIELDHGDNRMVRRGVARADKGAWEDAVNIWLEVIRNEPENASALYNLGVAHEGLGDLEHLRIARDLYQKAAAHGDKSLYADAVARVQDMIHQSNDWKRD